APPSLAAVVRGSVAALPVDAQGLAASLAVLGAATPLAVAGQVGGVEDPTEALEGLLASGLARWIPGEAGTPVELSHPLVRAAIYDDLSPRRRRDLHLAAADLTRWGVSWAHRVAAADRADDELADELHAGADYEVARWDLSLAATYLAWASTVSSSRERSDERILLGVRLLLIDGQTARADTMVPRVEQCGETALRDLVLGMLAFSHADAAATERWFTSVTRLAGPPWVHADALGHLALLRTLQGRGADVVAAAEAALATGALDGVGTDVNVWWALAIGVALQRGAPAGLDRLDERLAEPASEVSVGDAELLAVRGMLRSHAGRVGDAVTDLRTSIEMARNGAPYRQLPRAHLSLARALYLAGEWDEAQVQSRTALSLMDDTRVWMGQLAEGSMVPVLAARGQFELADQYAAAVRAAAGTLGTMELDGVARLATAALARSRGDAAGVIAALEPLTDPGHGNHGPMGLLAWWPMLITARIDAGATDVDSEIDAFVVAASTATLDVTAIAAELRARLAAARGDAEVAGAEFERALAATRPHAPVLERALLHHAYGRLLRDRGSRRQALVQLRTAHELLVRLGAEAYRMAVAEDLAAWSERTPTPAEARSPFTLTPREQDVVSLVTKGLTNREIGGQLYISAKAVEYHLANVYGKLGIRSRRELRDALATA
ncbi:MAG: LuxR C-terminal-related transcriptional regulator, partial [Ilumatobacteraceae bacterium]